MKKMFVLLILSFALFNFFSCCDFGKSPASPEENWPHSYEIMYERVLPIINPNEKDVDKECASLESNAGGQNSSFFTKIRENKWTARFPNVYDEDSIRHVYLLDKKVEKVYGDTIARDLYMKGDRDADWVKLTVIESNPAQSQNSEWAAVILKSGKVQNPY